jgi:hypothetical protein
MNGWRYGYIKAIAAQLNDDILGHDSTIPSPQSLPLPFINGYNINTCALSCHFDDVNIFLNEHFHNLSDSLATHRTFATAFT